MCVKTISSTEAQKHFGDLLMQVNREPVAIKKHDKEIARLISMVDFKAMSQEHTTKKKH